MTSRSMYLATLFASLLPSLALAQEAVVPTAASGGLETAITLGYYISTLGFLIATIMMAMAVKKFGSSALGSIFTYFFIGTGTFLVITIFQSLGNGFFAIAPESMDIWWHLMFYIALLSYFAGLHGLVSLGTSDPTKGMMRMGAEKMWAGAALFVLALIFVIPNIAEPWVNAYNASSLSSFGLHHFLAFILAGVVAWYLVSAKKNLGQIGRAIANPMLIAIAALGLQHFWELLNESWKVVQVTSEVGEGGEKIFLTIAAIGIAYAAWQLRAYSMK